MADWALINMVNGQETIVNIITADETFVNGLTGYDYKLDMSNYDPIPDNGDYYDPGMDTFSHPPEDYNQEFTDAMSALAASLTDALSARSNVSNSEDAADAILEANTSSVPESAAENLWPAIVLYLTDNDE